MTTFLLSNPILSAYQGSDFFGKVIFISLFILSVITWTLFIKKFFLQRNIKERGLKMVQSFQKKRQNPLSIEIGEALHPFAFIYRNLKENTLELLQKNRSVLQQNGATCLSHSDISLLEAQVMSAISSETKALEKNVFILSTIVALAPFLGLLGTVWGILLTFAELQTGATVNASSAIMGGLAMALGTTVLGLLVAIPALIGYNYLKASMGQLAADMEDFSHLLLASIELQYRQVDISHESP